MRWVILCALALLPAGCQSAPPLDAPVPSWTKTELASADYLSGKDAAGRELASPANLDALPRARRPYRVALIAPADASPGGALTAGFTRSAQELGVRGDVLTSAPDRADAQADQVRAAIRSGVDALCIVPADPVRAVAALRPAQQRHIPIFAIARPLDERAARAAGLTPSGFVIADGVTAGRLAGLALIRLLRGRGQVVAVGGQPGAAVLSGFATSVNGSLDMVATQPTGNNTRAAYRAASTLLARYPDLAGIFCPDGPSAAGTLQALRQAGKQDSLFLVVDGNWPGIQPAIMIDDHPELMGRYGLRIAVGVLDGRIVQGDTALVPQRIRPLFHR